MMMMGIDRDKVDKAGDPEDILAWAFRLMVNAPAILEARLADWHSI